MRYIGIKIVLSKNGAGTTEYTHTHTQESRHRPYSLTKN